MNKNKSIISLFLIIALICGSITDMTYVSADNKKISDTNCFDLSVVTGGAVTATPPAIEETPTPEPTSKPTPKPTAKPTKKPVKKPAKKQVLTVKVSQHGKRHVRLRWNSIKYIDRYKIKISGGLKKTVKLSKKKRTYIFKIDEGKVYHVRITAIKGKKRVSKSKKITICKPVKASTVRYTKLSDDKVLITWKRGRHTKTFQIYRQTGKGKYKVVGSSKKARFVDKNISAGKNYKYIIKSINIASKTKYSSNNRGTCFTTKKIVNTSHQKYTYTEMSADISLLKRTYSRYVSVRTIGNSCDNRKLYDVVIGNTGSGRSIIVIGALHAREYMTAQLCMAQIEDYLKNHNNKNASEATAGVLNKIAIHYIPMANPDGVTISQFGMSGIRNSTLRKALRKMKVVGGTKYWKSNARGVDLNKNFNYNYIAKYGGKRGSDGYTGESVNSEPETRAITAFLEKMKNSGTLKGLINYHATGSILFGEAKGSVKHVVTKMYNLAKKITGYADSSSYEENINEHSKKKNIGNLREYAMYKKEIPSITLEIGKKACPLSANEFPSIWQKNKSLVIKEAKLFTE